MSDMDLLGAGPDHDGQAVKALLDGGATAVQLADFAMASAADQNRVVENMGLSVKLFRALEASGNPALTALYRTLVLTRKEG